MNLRNKSQEDVFIKTIYLPIIPIALQNVALQILKFAIACPESRSGVYADDTFQEQTEQSEVCNI